MRYTPEGQAPVSGWGRPAERGRPGCAQDRRGGTGSGRDGGERNGDCAMSSEDSRPSDFVVTDRRGGDRRRHSDRRQRSIPVAVERRSGGDRRQQGERRRQVDPTTCERDYSDEEIAFMKAMDQYKRANRRPFPTWSEVLEVLRSLGYRKVELATALPGLPVDAHLNGRKSQAGGAGG